MGRKYKPVWVLLYRLENGLYVYRYEALKRYELNSRLKEGWRLLE